MKNKKIKYNPIIEFHEDKMEKGDYFKIHKGSRKDCGICKMKNKKIKEVIVPNEKYYDYN